MNAKGDANRSVRMTKQRLYQALITLLQQKSLREITVRELTELAGISRGTFYFHYADIYALMDQMEAAQLARLTDLVNSATRAGGTSSCEMPGSRLSIRSLSRASWAASI